MKKLTGLLLTLSIMCLWTLTGVEINLSMWLTLVIASILGIPWCAYWAAKDYEKIIRKQ